MKKISKSASFKIVIAALSVLLVAVSALTVWLGIKNNRANGEIQRMNGEISQNNSLLSEKDSENESLKEQQSSEAQSYEDKINSENKAHQSKVDELNGKINDLQKQLAAKKETATKPAMAPPSYKPPAVVPSGDKTVYLTFDDGPSPNTPAILDILDRYGVKATFFVINGGYNKYMKDIVARGHQIALHSYSHDYSKIYSSEAAYFDDLEKISNVVEQQTGVRTNVIRFPGGSSNTVSKKYSKGIMTRLTKSVTEKGYVYFDWNCSNGDATGKKTTVDIQLSYCSQYPKSAKNIVVLMHDVGNKKMTVQSLPKIIEYYRDCGMSFGVLTENTPPIHHGVSN